MPVVGLRDGWTLGGLDPTDATSTYNAEYRNQQKLTRGPMLRKEDGGFFYTGESFVDPETGMDYWGDEITDFEVADNIAVALDNRWVIFSYVTDHYPLPDGYTTGSRRCLLAERRGTELIYRDNIEVGISVVTNNYYGYASRSDAQRLNSTSIVVAYNEGTETGGNVDPQGRPRTAVVTRVDDHLELVANDVLLAGTRFWNYLDVGFISQMATLSETRWAVTVSNHEDFENDYLDYGVVMLVVCDWDGTTLTVGAPRKVKEYTSGEDPCTIFKLTEDSVIEFGYITSPEPDLTTYQGGYACRVVNIPTGAGPWAWIDHEHPLNTGNGPEGPGTGWDNCENFWWGGQAVRIDDNSFIHVYKRRGNLFPHRIIYSDHYEEYDPVYVGQQLSTTQHGGMAIMAVIGTVGEDGAITFGPQHFVDTTYPTWDFPDHVGGYSSSWGAAIAHIVKLREGEFEVCWTREAFIYTDQPFGPASASEPGNYGVGPWPDTEHDITMITHLHLDETSTSGLSSTGGSDVWIEGYPFNHNMTGRMCALPDGKNLVLGADSMNLTEWPFYTYREGAGLSKIREGMFLFGGYRGTGIVDHSNQYGFGVNRYLIRTTAPPSPLIYAPASEIEGWSYKKDLYRQELYPFKNGVLVGDTYVGEVTTHVEEWGTWQEVEEHDHFYAFEAWIISFGGRGTAQAGPQSQRTDVVIQPKSGI